ncbi:hypothetical protein FraQA3DRAFT_0099 [Frankia sp. QA3]|nr:hypothetical protein FraQA3DRAFT_0099 [Frankia sp. QA3]
MHGNPPIVTPGMGGTGRSPDLRGDPQTPAPGPRRLRRHLRCRRGPLGRAVRSTSRCSMLPTRPTSGPRTGRHRRPACGWPEPGGRRRDDPATRPGRSVRRRWAGARSPGSPGDLGWPARAPVPSGCAHGRAGRVAGSLPGRGRPCLGERHPSSPVRSASRTAPWHPAATGWAGPGGLGGSGRCRRGDRHPSPQPGPARGSSSPRPTSPGPDLVGDFSRVAVPLSANRCAGLTQWARTTFAARRRRMISAACPPAAAFPHGPNAAQLRVAEVRASGLRREGDG